MDGLALFHGPNAGLALDLYDRYLTDPASLDPQTRALFEMLPALTSAPEPVATPALAAAPAPTPATNGASPTVASVDAGIVANAVTVARNIRTRGHLAAHIDPLGTTPLGDPGLKLANNGLRPDDLVALPASIVGGPIAETSPNALEAIERLRVVYSGTTGYDIGHVNVAEERAWLREAVESCRFNTGLSADVALTLLRRLTQIEAFERFLQQAFPGQKRFSIEGTDMLVPILDEVIREAAASGTLEVVMGMAHRGRLNVLAHVLGKPYEQLFAEFREAAIGMGPAPTEGINRGWTGDVKYHLGATGAMREGGEVRVMLTLASNPSHLEYVDPVIEGMTRASQERRAAPGIPRQDDRRALPILIHGDAAFPGEGVTAETLNLSQLVGYYTGGTIHIIVNNQLGFTTGAHQARSTLYASDLAKGFEIPIVHVNADDPAACIAAARLAHAYRTRFRKDFLIDLVGYRRWGHNEGDQPAFTQPMLYEHIGAHPTARALWAERLEGERLISLPDTDAMLEKGMSDLRDLNRRSAAEAAAPDDADEHDQSEEAHDLAVETAVPAEKLRAYNEAMLQRPGGFAPHATLERILERRRTALTPDGAIDWGHAESLALASILADGTPIRLTGQDTERGTFSQRHLVLHDATSGQINIPLQMLPGARASFAVYNSPLSENGALGFEYGYCVHAPETLVLWEAQFGDFANAAQVIIDQFLVASGAKWRQEPSLVVLLPHGFEGQGPEHSSARLERFLQLAANDNLRIVNLTTAAQYFHVLRRQAALLERAPRPLVVMTPKSLLRHARAASTLGDLAAGRFQTVIDDPDSATGRRKEVTRLVLCSGKVYVDLVSSEQRGENPAVAIARVEQLYPFPAEQIEAALGGYPHLREVVWLQEEPQNMGAWGFIAPRLRELLRRDVPLLYVGRTERASPAVGSARVHAAEQAKIVADAFTGVRPLQPTT